MSTMSGSEIARLVLGYLQMQQMDNVAQDFCRLSPFLREEYTVMKRGLKVMKLDKPRTLFSVIKDFIEAETILSEFFDAELARYDQIPYELLRVQSLKDKIQYVCRMARSDRSNQPTQSQSVNATVTRKRPNTCVIQSDYESDSTTMSSPQATNENDLPGYDGSSRPPSKRRKLFDPNLIINDGGTSFDGIKSENQKMSPVKSTPSFQDPTSSKYLQMSTSKGAIPGKELSEMFMAHGLPPLIAENINSALGDGNISLAQLSGKIDDICETFTFEPMINDLHADFTNSSYDTSKGLSETEYETARVEDNRELNTPLPNEPSRYNLRSTGKSRSAQLNTSVESKRKKNSKVQILSDEQINPLECAIVLSDTEEPVEPVSTTSQTQYFMLVDPASGTWKYTPMMTDKYSHTDEQTQSYAFGLQNQIITPFGGVINAEQSNGQIINILDNNGIFNANILGPNQIVTESASNQGDSTIYVSEFRDRVIMVDKDEVNKEGAQSMEIDQQQSGPEGTKETLKKQPEQTTNDQTKEKPNPLAQFKIISGQKVVTPKQSIKPNIPSSSRSLSTPRDKIKKVLDFNTPSRFRLAELVENKNESFSNTSRFFSETPQNRSITSSLPSSAPPKVNSVFQSHKVSIEKGVESTTDVFVPSDENTVVSVEGETPKVRKNNRRSCVRTISAHKEINPEENEKRLKRVASAKKKICPEDGDSNGSEADNKKEEPKVPQSKESAMEEWNRIQLVKKNPGLFDQYLREESSKKEENQLSTGRKKRQRRTKKKPAAKSAAKSTAKPAAKIVVDESTKAVDISVNSSFDVSMNSTMTDLAARMLEENLKSAKKATPIKQDVPKSAKKKTPMGKLQIKLPPMNSPKNKALKRLKSSKSLAPAQTAENVVSSALPEKPVEVEIRAEISEPKVSEKQLESQASDQAPIVVSENTTDDLEVAQNLISLQEVILQKENEKKKALQPQQPEVQNDSVSMSQFEVPLCKTISEPMTVDRTKSSLLKSVTKSNLSMSALLETPFKDNSQMFPKTPGFNTIMPQLTTPMILRPCESLLDDSIFKNPAFPTPNFPITPGSIFTPFKDIMSPRSEEVIYGAANRPTDYSSSSSYYKPDESDGIDKQIHASMSSARTNSGIYSADEIDDSSKVDDTTQNTSRASSSSSSSSSDSDTSDSDSDSDSSSSDSDTSQISQKAEENTTGDVEQNQIEEPAAPSDIIDEDTTQLIKSHLVSIENDVNIAQNILLSEPEPPIIDKEAEHQKALNEKRIRLQESMRQQEMKNHEKTKPKQPKKGARSMNELKRERLQRVAPTPVSPSKRKSSQPMKVVSIQNQQIYSQVVNVVANHTVKVAEVGIKTQSVTTERLISEAAGDNAIVDASDVSTTQKAQKRSIDEEESVEAIKNHLTRVRNSIDPAAEKKKEALTPTQLSPEGLVDMLSEKQKKFNANRPKAKTEVIAPLPLTRTTRSRAKNLITIAPARNLMTKPKETTSTNDKKTAKPTEPARETRRSKDNKPTEKPVQKAKVEPKKTEQTKAEPPKSGIGKATSSIEAMRKPEISLVTPAKEKRSRDQIREIFGDCTDIETPIKSPPRKIAIKKPEEVKLESKVEAPITEKKPVQHVDSQNNKYEADSSNVNDDSEESDDSDSSDSDDDDEDDSWEMALSIDETDKSRFISMRENASAISRAPTQNVTFNKYNLVLDGVKITLEASDVMELYTQDVNSVVEMKKERQQRRSTKEIKTEASHEPTSSSEINYGQPLHTSTPSPPKIVTPKINIKHKTSVALSPKSAKKQNAGKAENCFNGIKIDDVLFQLHPTE